MQEIETIGLARTLRNPRDRNATIKRKILEALSLRVIRFKPIMADKELSLRIFRLRDLTQLETRFRPEVILQAAGRKVRPFRSLFAFHNWLKTSFNLLYLIEIQTHGKRRITGFVGFYALRPAAARLSMSLAIFDADDRGRGYGTRVVRLVCNFLRYETGIERVFVEVAKRNHAALSFFQSCSFRRENEPAIPC